MKTWIFQGNPGQYQIDEYLRTYNPILWAITKVHFRYKISKGDDVYIWRSDGDDPQSGGIVAKGKIMSLPKEREDDAPHLWIIQPENQIALRVEIEINEVRLSKEEGMIKRAELAGDERVAGMRILQVPMETNYQLEPQHAEYINELWEQRKKRKE